MKLYKLLIVPEHLWADQDAVNWTDDEMIGTGPFTLKTFTPQAVTLVPNEDYWGDEAQGRPAPLRRVQRQRRPDDRAHHR